VDLFHVLSCFSHHCSEVMCESLSCTLENSCTFWDFAVSVLRTGTRVSNKYMSRRINGSF